jgi:hypothetical protein
MPSLELSQAEGCVELAGFDIQAHTRASYEVALDAFFDAAERRLRMPEALLVPEVYASLILHLDFDPQISGRGVHPTDDGILGIPREVRLRSCMTYLAWHSQLEDDEHGPANVLFRARELLCELPIR